MIKETISPDSNPPYTAGTNKLHSASPYETRSPAELIVIGGKMEMVGLNILRSRLKHKDTVYK